MIDDFYFSCFVHLSRCLLPRSQDCAPSMADGRYHFLCGHRGGDDVLDVKCESDGNWPPTEFPPALATVSGQIFLWLSSGARHEEQISFRGRLLWRL